MISLAELKELQNDWLNAENEVTALKQENAKLRGLLADFDKWKVGKLGVEQYYDLKHEKGVLLSALHQIYDRTEGCADGATDADAHDRLCLEISDRALRAINSVKESND